MDHTRNLKILYQESKAIYLFLSSLALAPSYDEVSHSPHARILFLILELNQTSKGERTRQS